MSQTGGQLHDHQEKCSVAVDVFKPVKTVNRLCVIGFLVEKCFF
jgi:hypothetical protein